MQMICFNNCSKGVQTGSFKTEVIRKCIKGAKSRKRVLFGQRIFIATTFRSSKYFKIHSKLKL